MATIRRVLTDESRGTSRILGGLLVTAGVLAVLARRTEFENPWGDFVVLLLLVVLVKGLFWTGFAGARWSDATQPWQSVYMLAAVVLTPVTLFQFITWIDGGTDAPLNWVWIFLVTAAIAGLVALAGRVRVAGFLGAIAVVVAWVALWQELVDDGVLGDPDSLRWVLLSAAAVLLPLAGAVAASRAPDGAGSDVVTASAIAAVAAGGLHYFIPGFFITPEGLDGGGATPTTLFWDIELLFVSLGLIAAASTNALGRGPGYAGAFGFAVFVISVGLDLDDSSPAGKVLGWPLVLLVLGAILVLASALPALRRRI